MRAKGEGQLWPCHLSIPHAEGYHDTAESTVRRWGRQDSTTILPPRRRTPPASLSKVGGDTVNNHKNHTSKYNNITRAASRFVVIFGKNSHPCRGKDRNRRPGEPPALRACLNLYQRIRGYTRSTHAAPSPSLPGLP